MSNIIIIDSEDFYFVPNDSYLQNNDYECVYAISSLKHLNFFLPPISGITENGRQIKIKIFSKKCDVYICTNRVDFMNENVQMYLETDKNVIIHICIKNNKWYVETEKLIKEDVLK